jgi:uncharacterized protein YkwD
MKLKLLLFCALTVTINAVTIKTEKDTYTSQEDIKVNIGEMSGHEKDWVGIYPVDSTNEWENVLRWNWTEGIIEGTTTLTRLPVGNYEARIFFQNSFNLEGKYEFSIVDGDNPTTIKTEKDIYTTNENITMTVTNLLGDNQDWFAIYPSGSSNAWENVIQWDWTNGIVNGQLVTNPLPKGDYEARVFFKNSYKLESKYSFKVENGENPTTLTTNKEFYTRDENIIVNFTNLLGHNKDWVAIYPKDSSNQWANVIQWHWTEGKKDGNTNFTKLPEGKYEARVFFRNSFILENKYSFEVKQEEVEEHIIPKIDNNLKAAYLKAINDAREEARVCGERGEFQATTPVVWNDALYSAAYEHSQDMAKSNKFSHNGSGTKNDWTPSEFGFSNFTQRISHYNYAGGIRSENIAAGQETVAEVMNGWLNSDGHCANIMNAALQEVGMSMVVDDMSDFKFYWTQNFGGAVAL